MPEQLQLPAMIRCSDRGTCHHLSSAVLFVCVLLCIKANHLPHLISVQRVLGCNIALTGFFCISSMHGRYEGCA